MAEFQAWPKIPRLNRNCVVTEKIDGTNAAVLIEQVGPGWPKHEEEITRIDLDLEDSSELAVFAQSRKRFITPGDDNFGFASWVAENALELAAVLGEGRHFGEWWGKGIQRGYGLDGKRFSLFNAGRWHDQRANGMGDSICPNCCSVVPVVALDNRIEAAARAGMEILCDEGSLAAPGFDAPEGVIVYHTAARSSFKVTFDQDDLPKTLAEAGVTATAEAVA